MVRGTFANVRLRNLLVPGSEGTWTVHVPSGRGDDDLRRVAALPRGGHAARSSSPARSTAPARRATGRPRARTCSACSAVIAESYERIHRSNLLMMGILPLQFLDGETPRVARPDRPRGVLDQRRRERRGARGDGAGRRQGVPRPRPARHAARARVPAPRRDPAVRAAPVALDLN